MTTARPTISAAPIGQVYAMTTNNKPDLGDISIQPLTTALADNFLECLAVIAGEKKYLAMVDAFTWANPSVCG